MESQFSNHSSNHQPGRLLVAGGCANWTTLVAPLVDYGFQVEMVSDVERAGIRCVEQVVDAVVIDLNQEIDEISKTIRLLRTVSHYTKIVVMCESTHDVPQTLAAYDNLQSVVSDVSPNDFVNIMRTAVRVARLCRERNERIHTLKSLTTQVHDPKEPTADLEKLLRILQAHNPRTQFPRLKLPEIDTLTEVLARSLDPLTASRAAVDFIERCLPGAMIVSWLIGPDSQTGLAASAGNGGANAILAARLLSDLETQQLPQIFREKKAAHGGRCPPICGRAGVRAVCGSLGHVGPMLRQWRMFGVHFNCGTCGNASIASGTRAWRCVQRSCCAIGVRRTNPSPNFSSVATRFIRR
jgi:hypothetical protein